MKITEKIKKTNVILLNREYFGFVFTCLIIIGSFLILGINKASADVLPGQILLTTTSSDYTIQNEYYEAVIPRDLQTAGGIVRFLYIKTASGAWSNNLINDSQNYGLGYLEGASDASRNDSFGIAGNVQYGNTTVKTNSSSMVQIKSTAIVFGVTFTEIWTFWASKPYFEDDATAVKVDGGVLLNQFQFCDMVSTALTRNAYGTDQNGNITTFNIGSSEPILQPLNGPDLNTYPWVNWQFPTENVSLGMIFTKFDDNGDHRGVIGEMDNIQRYEHQFDFSFGAGLLGSPVSQNNTRSVTTIYYTANNATNTSISNFSQNSYQNASSNITQNTAVQSAQYINNPYGQASGNGSALLNGPYFMMRQNTKNDTGSGVSYPQYQTSIYGPLYVFPQSAHAGVEDFQDQLQYSLNYDNNSSTFTYGTVHDSNAVNGATTSIQMNAASSDGNLSYQSVLSTWNDSDKLQIAGTASNGHASASIKDIYVQLKNVSSPQGTLVYLGSNVYDLQMTDPIYGETGIAIKVNSPTDTITNDGTNINIFLYHNATAQTLTSFNYPFDINVWPHSGWLTDASQFTTLHSQANLTYDKRTLYIPTGIYTGITNTVYSTGAITYSIDPYNNSTAVNLTVAPPSDSVTIAVNTWQNTGNFHKQWTEDSANHSLVNVVHTVGDLEASKYYNVTVNSSNANLSGCSLIGSNYVCYADGTGEIRFTYSGGYSSQTFDVQEENDPSALATDEAFMAANVAADKAALTSTAIKGSNPDLSHITVALTNPLPSLGANSSTITWVSSNPSVVSNDGQTVNRPAYSNGNATVTMTATITDNSASDTKTFTLTVLRNDFAFSYTILPNNTAQITGYIGTESDIIIPASTPDGYSITSIGDSAFANSTLTSIVISDSVTSIGASAFSFDESLTSVTIGNGVTSIGDSAFLYTPSLTSIIIPNSVTSIGANAFYDSALASIIIPDSVTSIGATAFYESDDSFYSSLTSVIIGNGVTSIGAYAFGDNEDLLVAYFLGNAPTMGDGVFDSASSSFTVHYASGKTGFTNPWYTNPTIAGIPNSILVAADKVDLVDSSIQGANLDLSDVTVALANPLPSLGANGSTITWVSSNPSVVSNNGQTVNRPAYGQSNATATLTATITNATGTGGSASDTKAFTLTVLAITTDPDIASVAADKAALVASSIQGTNPDLSHITVSLTNPLPSLGTNGSTITWVSSNTIVVSNNGQTVNRPAYGAGDVTVTLTATITKGVQSDTKEFTLTILASTTDPDIALVAADKSALVADNIKGSNSDLSNITTSLTNPLPSSGSNGSTITWISNTPSVISNDGQTIIRPAYGAGNATVTLTATITKGVQSDTKEFTLTILASTTSPVVSPSPTGGGGIITMPPPIYIPPAINNPNNIALKAPEVKTEVTTAKPSTNQQTKPKPTTTTKPIIFTKPLKSKTDIKNLQIVLNYSLKLKLKVDGVSGKQTIQAIKLFQKKNKLISDGVVGPKTRVALNRVKIK